jgi:MscS family membrane protein
VQELGVAKLAAFGQTLEAAEGGSKDACERRVFMITRTFFRLFVCLAIALAGVGPEARSQGPDPKYRTPRATVRTLYVAADLAREYPSHIADAVGCLDLSGLSDGKQFGGMAADRLEALLSALEVKSYQVPDDATLDECVLPDTQSYRLVLRRMADGNYRFDRATVKDISRIWAELQKKVQAKSQQTDTLAVRPEFNSPRATLRTFIRALNHEDAETAIHCLDLRDLSPAARHDVGYQMARRLKQVIDRTRLVIFQQLPDTNHGPHYVWFSQPSGLIDLAREYGGERKGEWLFSAATVRSIDRLYADSEGQPYVPEIRELIKSEPGPVLWREPELWLPGRLPDWARSSVLTTRAVHLKIYQLAGIVFLGVSVIGVYLLVRGLASWVMVGLLRLAGVKLPRRLLRQRLRAFSGLTCLVYIRWGVLLLALDRVLLATALTALNPLIWLCAAWVAFRFIDLVGDAVQARLSASERHVVASQMLLPVSSLLIKILILLGTLFELMHLFDWQVTAVLTGLGIGGLAFALGAQDSLKNLFGSFTLIADRPFIVGERVKIGQHGEGVVEVVGLRSTRIRTGEDALLTVPNSDLTTMHITNYGRRRPCRCNMTLSVIYATPSERLLAFRDGIRELIRKRRMMDQDKSTVAISDLVPSAIEVQVDVYFEVTEGESERAIREELIVEILRLAERLRLDFASPTQMVRLTLPGAEPACAPGEAHIARVTSPGRDAA